MGSSRTRLEVICERVVACTDCLTHRPSVVSADLPPRGWAGSTTEPASRLFVFVGANPGHPLKMKRGEESLEVRAWREAGIADVHGVARRPPTDPAHAARTVLALCDATYQQVETSDPRYDNVNGQELRFHRRCMALARMCMRAAGIPERADWRSHVWFTDLVKCSTRIDREAATSPCVQRCTPHLRAELEAIRPAVIVALTRTVQSTIVSLFPEWASRVVYGRVFRTGLTHSTDERLRDEVRRLVRR